MTEKAERKIRIRWSRSGIGFSYRAKEAIRSLGLRRLYEIVERPDTPQVRGLVARVARLVEVVNAAPGPNRLPGPEYTVIAAEPGVETPVPRKAPPAREKAAPVAEEKPAAAPAKVEREPKAEVPAKAAPSPAKKPAKRAAAAKTKDIEKAPEVRKKPKGAARKESRLTRKGKK